MFDKSFDYRLLQKRASKEYGVITESVYSFNSSKRRYIVIVEEYDFNVFVPKFFPSAFRNSQFKYNIILNDFEASRIVRTCINITLQILKEHDDASFAFMGSYTVSGTKKESKILTQRFRIYRLLMYNFFSKENWVHLDDEVTSTYLLVPVSKTDIEGFVQKVIRMFTHVYPDLETINL